MNKIEKDLYQYKLDNLKDFDGDVYIRHFNSPEWEGSRHIFNVYYQGNRIGHFKLSKQGDYVTDADILPPFRRKGIASAVYNFIEKYLGIKLQPSPMYQTQDGKDFWKNRKERKMESFNNWLSNKSIPASEEEVKNYMFFSSLQSIKEKVDKILSMDKLTIDAMLEDGHDWANDHIATSKDDIEEVYNWINSKMGNSCGM